MRKEKRKKKGGEKENSLFTSAEPRKLYLTTTDFNVLFHVLSPKPVSLSQLFSFFNYFDDTLST